VRSRKPREIAVHVLERRLIENRFVEELLDESLNHSNLSSLDRSLCLELVYGVVRRLSTLDFLIDRKTSLDERKARVRILLQTGLYQIFFLTRIPDHAAVHETVQLAKQMGMAGQSGLINAVLRGFIREKDLVLKMLDDLKISSHPLGFSHPKWLYEKWRMIWSEREVLDLMEWNNSPPPTYARLNHLKSNSANLETRWNQEGVKFLHRKFSWVPDGTVYELLSHPPISRLNSFSDGLFYIQDPSTLLAVEQLQVQSNDKVLDLCAAPGGKMTFIAAQMQNHGNIVAVDTNQARLALLRENYLRMGVTSVNLMLAEKVADLPPGQFDRILVDAPCSNTGVMRRRIDLRWRISRNELVRLVADQHNLLNLAASKLKTGGMLVYSTCSLEPEENEDISQRFLSEHPEFREAGSMRLLPFRDHVDGAYVVRFVRGAV